MRDQPLLAGGQPLLAGGQPLLAGDQPPCSDKVQTDYIFNPILSVVICKYVRTKIESVWISKR